MSVLAVENALLTKVAGGGASENYDQAAGEPVAKWEGELGVHVTEKVEDVERNGSLDQVVVTHVLVPATLGLVPQTGDSVTYGFGVNVITRSVRVVEDHSTIGFLRLRFWDD